MQEFIQGAAAKLGIGADEAASATGGVLGLFKEFADGDDVTEMLGKLPGAGELVEKAGGGDEGGGLLGGLGGAVGGLVGGDAAKALGAVDGLSKLGLDGDKLAGFLQLFTTYVKPLLGDDLLNRLAAKVPGLSELLR